MDAKISMDWKAKARDLVTQMTLAEKASLCSGKDHNLPAVCFPGPAARWR